MAMNKEFLSGKILDAFLKAKDTEAPANPDKETIEAMMSATLKELSDELGKVIIEEIGKLEIKYTSGLFLDGEDIKGQFKYELK